MRNLILTLLIILGSLLMSISCDSDLEDHKVLNSIVPPDTTPPSVIEFYPEPGDTWVSIRQPIEVRFTEDIAINSVDEQSFIITPDVNSTREVCRTVAACTVWNRLEYSTQYDVTITTAITDTIGNKLDTSLSWSFITRDTPPPPVITGFSPLEGPIGIPLTIFGTGFDSLWWENRIWFGEDSAFVVAATESTLQTMVPITATSGEISVRNQVAYDTAATLFTFLPPPDTLFGNYNGIYRVISNFGTDSVDTMSQYITLTFISLGSPIYIMNLDLTMQSENERNFCDVAGSFFLQDNGLLLDVDVPNWTNKTCDTTSTPAGFYGATVVNDTLELTFYNPRIREIREFRLTK